MLLTAMQDNPNQGIQAYGGTLLIGLLGDRGLSLLAEIAWGGGKPCFSRLLTWLLRSLTLPADAASPYK